MGWQSIEKPNIVINVQTNVETGLVNVSFKIDNVVSSVDMDTTGTRAMAAALNIAASVLEAATMNTRRN